ncbi:DUF4127 family protein [bacterium]|nr:DUF4127 family protein [bacterium]
MSRPLLLIPLDDRPATYRLPAEIAAIGRLSVLRPSREAMGNLERPADPDSLLAWLEAHAAEAGGAVVALDTLGYGGLIPSRQSAEPFEVIRERLERLRALKQRHPELSLYAFSITMRLSAEAAVEEEKPYWATHGRAIYAYSYHQDKYEQEGLEADRLTAETARESIPDDILEDYLATRRRNVAITRLMIDWAAEGCFEALLLTQDDTGRFGLNVREQRGLVSKIEQAGVGDKVLVYPGADEVASVLVGRHLNRVRGQHPRFFVQTSTPEGGTLVPMYEDRPLEKTIASQVRAVGGEVVPSLDTADFALMANTPASGQGDLVLDLHLERVNTPPRDLEPFVRALASSSKPVALADVAYANGADLALFRYDVDPTRLAAFAAWNTAGNTLGTVVAQASAWLDPAHRDEKAQQQYMLERLADDLLYQACLRKELRAELKAGASIPQLEASVGPRLEALWRERFPQHPIRRIAAKLPWKRLFEVDLKVEA